MHPDNTRQKPNEIEETPFIINVVVESVPRLNPVIEGAAGIAPELTKEVRAASYALRLMSLRKESSRLQNVDKWWTEAELNRLIASDEALSDVFQTSTEDEAKTSIEMQSNNKPNTTVALRDETVPPIECRSFPAVSIDVWITSVRWRTE